MIQVAGQADLVALELVLQRARLLQAHDIRVLLCQERKQPAARGRTYAVDVQGDDTHTANDNLAALPAGLWVIDRA